MDSFRDSSSAVDADDNAFYEELTRQILMLTDEDDDHRGVTAYPNGDQAELWRRPVVYGGGGSRQVAKNYYSWSETGKSSVPRWMESLWANGTGGGTGVFIPSGATTGRHGKKSGRRRNNKNKTTKNNDRTSTKVYSTTGQKIHG